MSNVLFIGPYRQNDGWGQGAKGYIKALQHTSANVAIRPIYMAGTGFTKELPDDIIELEQKQFDGPPNIIIQNVLPTLLSYQPDAYNIGLFYIETQGIKHTGWIYRMNLMDEIWVASNHEKQVLEEEGVTVKISVVPMCIDIEHLQRQVKPLSIPGCDTDYTFYFIGEHTNRKNMLGLLSAFHQEFDKHEPVRLVIKCNKMGMHPDVLQENVSTCIKQLKQQMRLYPNLQNYHNEILVTGHLSEDEMLGLHRACDCLVVPSCGESLNRPAMEAMCVGNDLVVNGQTGMKDTVGIWGLKARSNKVPIIIPDAPMPTIYTGRETWQEVDILNLRCCLRASYESRNKLKPSGREEYMKRFSYEQVGNVMEDLIINAAN